MFRNRDRDVSRGKIAGHANSAAHGRRSNNISGIYGHNESKDNISHRASLEHLQISEIRLQAERAARSPVLASLKPIR